MFSVSVKTMERVALVTPVLVGALMMGACARPRGTLFPAMDPPRVWPAPPKIPRIKLIGTLSDSRDLQAAVSGMEALAAALRGPRPPIRLSGPHSISLRDPDLLAVADGSGGSVHIINLQTRSHTLVSGFGDQFFEVPIGVTWADEQLYVTDAGRHEIIVLDTLGHYRNRFGRELLKRPVGIAYDSVQHMLFVVDGAAHQLRVFRPSGQLVKTIGHRGNAPGEFNYPSHVCVAGDMLVVVDTGNFRVQLLGRDGSVVRTIGKKGNGAGDFALPKGVAVDSDGHIYVVDAQFENVQIFDQMGQLLLAFGKEGSGGGEFWLPAGIMIDAQDRIWVADAGNRRLQIFSYLRAPS